ncbi:MAG TPA: 50S ribosomal protein L1, partial [Sphingopyxis sp.]|nr:50S ribosomal protein L1 [Sphingopyxis sp.]
MAKLTKKQKALEGKVDALKLHAVDEAIKTVRELAS